MKQADNSDPTRMPPVSLHFQLVWGRLGTGLAFALIAATIYGISVNTVALRIGVVVIAAVGGLMIWRYFRWLSSNKSNLTDLKL